MKGRRLSSFARLDSEGVVHFDIPALLVAGGVEDTPANRDRVCRRAAELIRRRMPNVEIVATKRDGTQN